MLDNISRWTELLWAYTYAVQELRQQMGGLQSQLQQVQLERSTLQSRLKTSQAEIDSLQQVRQWYQQQLALAQEARVRLQNEMANMQVRLMLMQAAWPSRQDVCPMFTQHSWYFSSLPGWTDDSDWGCGTSEVGKCDSIPSANWDSTPLHQRQRAYCCSATEHRGILTNLLNAIIRFTHPLHYSVQDLR